MKKIISILLVMGLPFWGVAQEKATKSQAHKKATHKKAKTVKPAPPVPTWGAAHHYDAKSYVYFPDYYTYYDPQRGGYVFWKNGQYSFTPTVPPFMEKVDMSKERVQILKGLSLDLHPEQNYPRYMKLYPAEHSYDQVPVPATAGSDLK